MLFKCRFWFHRLGVRPEILHSWWVSQGWGSWWWLSVDTVCVARRYRAPKGLIPIIPTAWPSTLLKEKLKGECFQPTLVFARSLGLRPLLPDLGTAKSRRSRSHGHKGAVLGHTCHSHQMPYSSFLTTTQKQAWTLSWGPKGEANSEGGRDKNWKNPVPTFKYIEIFPNTLTHWA